MTPTMQDVLALQQAAFRADPCPPVRARIERLRRIIALVRDHQDRFVAAADADFGCRPAVQTRMELVSVVESATFAIQNVRRWMRPRRAALPAPMALLGARAAVFPQPKGVVGVMAPWNFPVGLLLGPLAGVLAAGNRAMLKPSEVTPAVSAAVAEAVRAHFAVDEVAVIEGDVAAARAFSALPFDHLLFTGSPEVGRAVMRAAADNLTPVTLELGGKCPAIIDHDADLAMAAERIMLGKCQNAGQACLAPDTIYAPRALQETFIAHCRDVARRWFPTMNCDYPAMINERHHARIQALVAEAAAAGARIETLIHPDEDSAGGAGCKVPFTFIIDPPGAAAASREEIFGPVMVLRAFNRLEDVIADLQGQERPLALYYFGRNPSTVTRLRAQTVAGAMVVNDTFAHAAVETLPLGGVGRSGMGAYHGKFGFDTFSHTKSVLVQGVWSPLAIFAPPYSALHGKLLGTILRG